ncbi:WD40 repeat-like protein [Athelia psychrophila]|uniref:WD40 repeat-like protein n=1 Tax=Athelia psychrophila TaxID=1759441 RepID=A0A166HKN0_9AGAM|nr:WD40 repeat-like protein [Fibularhizoctonia sp. CBS 109695]
MPFSIHSRNSSKSSVGSHKKPKDKDERFKKACSAAVDTLQTILGLAKDITGVVGGVAPGVQAGIMGALVVLDAVKQTSQNADDIQELSGRIISLLKIFEEAKASGGLSESTLERIESVIKKWGDHGVAAQKMSSRNPVVRFIRNNADANAIGGYIKSINSSLAELELGNMLSMEIAINESARATAAGISRLESGLHDGLQATTVIGSELDAHAQATAAGLGSVEVKLDSGLTLLQENARTTTAGISRVESGLHDGLQATTVIGTELTAHAQATATGLGNVEGKIDNGLTQAQHIREGQKSHANATATGIADIQDQIQTINPGIRAFLPPRAAEAAFDCGDRTPCLKGTRTDILELVETWIELGHIGDHAATSEIFWVNGGAGTGKSTIALTVAQTCKDRGILGASFFCSRDSAECSKPKLLFTTIAYQLSLLCDAFGEKVAAAMRSDPDMGIKSLSHQLEKLILEPLNHARDQLPSPCVVIIDALDECGDDSRTHAVLACLSGQVSRLARLRFLITSRPEQNITSVFSSDKLGARVRLNLHEVALATVTQDITHFLTESLADCGSSGDPVSASDIKAVSECAGGLFIFAATSVRFIMDIKSYSPVAERIASILKSGYGGRQSLSPYSKLDKLYMQVLAQAFPECDSHSVDRFRKVIGAIVLLRDPLSARDLQALLCSNDQDPKLVDRMLGNMHALILVPEDATKAIRLLHPSFHDFLIDAHRCTVAELVITTPEQHTHLAVACLHALQKLKQDMCNIQDACLLNLEVEDIDAKIRTCLPPWLKYACCHWGSHLAAGEVSDIVLELLEEFCCNHLLYWLEACSLLGVLRDALLCLAMVQKAIVGHENAKLSSQLLYDCERFTREFFPPISVSALQIYHSAMLFTPTKTHLRQKFSHLAVGQQYHGCDENWGSCVQTMTEHSGCVHSVAFSPDSTKIVSGSDDKTVRVWDVVTGACLSTLKGHSNTVKSVAFSPDSTKIVSGSDDKTVHAVYSVAFSPDSTKIVSGSDDKTVRVWDVVTGACLSTLKGHSNTVKSVAFSPDSTKIVSGSDDKTVCVWDVVTGACLSTLEGHSSSVRSVAFSPDSTKIVSGSDDKTVRMWDMVTGACLSTLEGHSSSVTAVAFSPDSTKIVSGSDDKTVRVWDVVTGACLSTLEGHSSSVRSVAFSPDSTKIVSGSDDKTVRVWDVVTGACLSTLEGHSSSVRAVAFSPDSTKIVSGSYDKTVRVWDVVTGACLRTLEGHSSSVIAVAFSPDSTKIVSGSYDKTVRVWDVVTGACLRTLEGHSSSVRSVAFSPDSTKIVFGSDDKTAQAWDASTALVVPTPDSTLGTSNMMPKGGYFLNSDGWICAYHSQKRALWVPVPCRGKLASSGGEHFALGGPSGRVTIINL